MILEALGFSYVLAGYTIPGASESLQQIGALGIAFTISLILVGLTHKSGAEIYKNSKIEEMMIKNSGAGFDAYKSITIETEYADEGATTSQKIYNRIDSGTYKKRWIICTITAIFVIFVAIGATYVRGQVLEKQLIQEISTATTNIYDTVPSELGAIQSSADNKALEEQQNADRKGGWATFIVLSIIFIFIQILGILFGFKWGFVGKESAKAYKITHKFNSVNEYEDYYEQLHRNITIKAEEKLQAIKIKITTLRTRLSKDEFASIMSNEERTYQISCRCLL